MRRIRTWLHSPHVFLLHTHSDAVGRSLGAAATNPTVSAAAKAPAQAETLRTLAEQLAGLNLAGVGLALLERGFAFLFHLGASILVFYACRDRGRFWLYPLAIVLHTALDFIAGLAISKAITIPTLALEGIIGVFSVLVFCGAYFLLYRRDRIIDATNQA